MAVRAARLIGKALVAPSIRPGCSSIHKDFPRTIDLRLNTLISIISDHVDSLVSQGFSTIILLQSHAGNFGPINQVVPILTSKYEKRARIVEYTDSQTFSRIMDDSPKKRGISQEFRGEHAGVGDTARISALRPDLVDMSAAQQGFIGDLQQMGEVLQQTRNFKAVTSTGVVGDPRLATAEMGREIIDDLSTAIADDLKRRLAQ